MKKRNTAAADNTGERGEREKGASIDEKPNMLLYRVTCGGCGAFYSNESRARVEGWYLLHRCANRRQLARVS